MVTITIRETGIAELKSPALMRDAEARMIDRAVDVLNPIARAEAPARTGRSKTFIYGQVREEGGHPLGRIYVGGKGFALRILGVGWGPREIRPRSRSRRILGVRRTRSGKERPPALMIPVAGGKIFRTFANRPGRAPDPWHERAARRGESAVERAADAAVVDLVP